jgi:hypothetical protein
MQISLENELLFCNAVTFANQLNAHGKSNTQRNPVNESWLT